MLGRQQIAGIPTAINELFKNSYDAYASRVVVDNLLDKNALLLRDDGVGMSERDFLDRWLTVGTDSKTTGGRFSSLAPPDGFAPRPVLGEKGIGRLAIASLGEQVLVMTRPRDVTNNSATTVALICWRFFTVPGLTLDDIRIPTVSIAPGGHVDHELVVDLTEVMLAHLSELETRMPPETVRAIRKELNHLRQLDFAAIQQLSGPRLDGKGYGTHFLVTPVDETLALETAPQEDGSASRLVKLLIGFTNSFSRKNVPGFRTAFREIREGSPPRDLLDGAEFFNEEDFSRVDHEFDGRFDENGTFHGTVRIFGGDPLEHVIPWPGSNGRTRCGPFTIRFGYVQGTAKQSRLSDVDYNAINAKLNRVAGLYIYRDGIRILPYGNSDVDYLNIEERRSKNAAYHFFSYRRLFGAVDINSDDNPDLQEKAGREGFRENLAYREMVAILKNMFVQLAADFFRSSTEEGKEYLRIRQALQQSARERRESNVRPQRNRLREELQVKVAAFENGTPQREVAEVVDGLRNELQERRHLFNHAASPGEASEIIHLDTKARRELRQISHRYLIERPDGVGLARDMQRDYSVWQESNEKLLDTTLPAAEEQLDRIVTAALSALTAPEITDRRVHEELLRASRADMEELHGSWGHSVERSRYSADSAHQHVLNILSDAIEAVEASISEATTIVSAASVEHTKAVLTARRTAYEIVDRSIKAQQQRLGRLQPILSRLVNDDPAPDEDLVALEEEVLALRDDAEADLELAQLGRAVEIINHEFSASVTAVRNNLRALRPWARINPDLRPIESNLSASFEHLDAYLTMFTPLQRRLYRRPVLITGDEIFHFVMDLFRDRTQRHDVSITMSDAFHRASVSGYPSTFYPVFLNLIDNALFWLNQRPKPRSVVLDYADSAWLVKDNGPGVRLRDEERIFEMNWSRKPGGRGVGLKVSRDVLRRNGYELQLRQGSGLDWPAGAGHGHADERGQGACFAIVPLPDTTESEDINQANMHATSNEAGEPRQ
ncbi:ATP-binding protein [Klenkia taihuensis]|nr:ATP-binding protein [Klenkia taihuensis]GHE08389.1 hypothetical protein GCM10011381_08980 [Klenkia taihuensis]